MDVDVLTAVGAGSVASGLVGLGMVGYVWRRRDVAGQVEFGLLVAAISLWAIGEGAQLLVADPAASYVIDRFLRIASVNIAPLMVVFVLRYTGQDEWLTLRWLAVLWLYPAVYVVLTVSPGWHSLDAGRAAVETITVGQATTTIVATSTLEDWITVLSWGTSFAVILVLVRALFRSRVVDRRHTAIVGAACLIPAVTNIAFNFGYALHPAVDVTPITLLATLAIVGWGIYEHDFLRMTPLPSDVLIDELPDPVLIVDDEDRVVGHNPAAEAAFDGADLEGTALATVAPDLEAVIDADELYAPGVSGRPDGRAATVYDPSVTPYQDQHGRDHGRLIVLRDVTAQFRRGERLAALQTASQQFITATSTTEIGELTVEFVERVLDRRAAGVFLLDETEERLTPVAVTDHVADRFRDGVAGFGPDSTAYEAFRTETQQSGADGESAPFGEYVAHPLGEHGVLVIGSEGEDAGGDAEDGQFASILARSTQVALTQVEREQQLRESRAEVERRNEQIEFFNGLLRHTLRNALLVIQGRADHLRAHVEGGQEHHLDRIVRWCDDLTDLTDEIRAINQTVTASEAERLDAVDLTELLRTQVTMLEAEHEDVEVALDVHEDLTVLANELVEKVVHSVLQNAVTHNDADRPHVDVSTQRFDEHVQVRIADDGPGMSEEMKETVFERDVATSHTSHGFGLYFVSVMMNLFGGRVWFEDNEPRGTVAVLEFARADS